MAVDISVGTAYFYVHCLCFSLDPESKNIMEPHLVHFHIHLAHGDVKKLIRYK